MPNRQAALRKYKVHADSYTNRFLLQTQESRRTQTTRHAFSRFPRPRVDERFGARAWQRKPHYTLGAEHGRVLGAQRHPLLDGLRGGGRERQPERVGDLLALGRVRHPG
jgi:hypothetical protein